MTFSQMVTVRSCLVPVTTDVESFDKMKQVTLYVEGQKTQAAGVISASLETDGKQCKV